MRKNRRKKVGSGFAKMTSKDSQIHTCARKLRGGNGCISDLRQMGLKGYCHGCIKPRSDINRSL